MLLNISSLYSIISSVHNSWIYVITEIDIAFIASFVELHFLFVSAVSSLSDTLSSFTVNPCVAAEKAA